MTTPTTDVETAVRAAARERYAERALIAAAAARTAGQAWADLDLNRIAESWLDLMFSRVRQVVVGAQLAAARGATPYVERVRRIRRTERRPAGRVEPRRLAGVAADGRSLDTLLLQPTVTTRQAIRRGARPRDAAVVGATHLDMIVRAEVTDAGRVADSVEIAATPTLGYVRMLSPPSCSRCVILAGRFYRFNDGFLRHPRCQCVHIPASEDQADDVRTDPRAYFDSLSEAEQNRVFTNDGAQAIRDGADIGRVVNARRGMTTTASGRLTTRQVFGRDVFTTTEGTGRRRNRGVRPARLMPEQIYLEAGGSRDEAIRLLRLHGYIT